MELLDLNDDCLIHLCLFLDAEAIVAFSETCVRVNEIAEKYFKYLDTYLCYIDSTESETKAVNTLHKIGTFLHTISLIIEHQFKSSNEFFVAITRSVMNLRELHLLGELCTLPFATLAPILTQLEKLTILNICWKEDCTTYIDLPLLCVNLREITISGQVVINPRSLPQLEHFDADLDSDTSLHWFFRQNRQMKKLSLKRRRTTNFVDLPSVASYLEYLEELHLDVKLVENPTTGILALSRFPHLQTLRLYSIPVSGFQNLLTNLAKLNQLRDIVIQSDLTRIDDGFFPGQQSLIHIATELKQLQSFVTFNIDWMCETVIEFVSQATNLISFNFWSGSRSNYIVTSNFLRELAKVRKSTVQTTMPPLNLTMFTMLNDLKSVFNEPDVATYIKLTK